MDIQTAIATVASGESLTVDAMNSVMLAVMQGEATDAQIGGLLVGLRMKGETIDEVVGAATAMRSSPSLPKPPDHFRNDTLHNRYKNIPSHRSSPE